MPDGLPPATSNDGPVTSVTVRRSWAPLAASWLLMGAELPILSAAVARLADPEINLAAFGGVVFPIAMVIEAPIIMLLAASTALSRDAASYRKLYRIMMWLGAGLTAVHALVAFTPIYDVITRGLLRPPEEVIEPARIGLMLLLPWTWAIGHRRFNQGALIRFGRSRVVGIGTALRLIALGAVLGLGLALNWSGVVVAGLAVSAGVIAEAAYIGWQARVVRRVDLASAPRVDPPLSGRAFAAFYWPLALTSLCALLAHPIVTAGISRMPSALESLAAAPAAGGLIFLFRSVGMAFNEVVVAMLERPGGYAALRRFARRLALALTAGALLVAATPLAGWWFGGVTGLPPDLSRLAVATLWIGLLMPAVTVFQSWHQGMLVHSRRTRGVTESVVIYLVVVAALLAIGAAWAPWPGLLVAYGATLAGNLCQAFWLARCTRSLRAEFEFSAGRA
jgi:hypothetical protein